MSKIFEVYHKDTGKVQSSGETRHKAWAKFYEDCNTFCDSIAEFKSHCAERGYATRLTNTNER